VVLLATATTVLRCTPVGPTASSMRPPAGTGASPSTRHSHASPQIAIDLLMVRSGSRVIKGR
jgi:hypothetical protein